MVPTPKGRGDVQVTSLMVGAPRRDRLIGGQRLPDLGGRRGEVLLIGEDVRGRLEEVGIGGFRVDTSAS